MGPVKNGKVKSFKKNSNCSSNCKVCLRCLPIPQICNYWKISGVELLLFFFFNEAITSVSALVYYLEGPRKCVSHFITYSYIWFGWRIYEILAQLPLIEIQMLYICLSSPLVENREMPVRVIMMEKKLRIPFHTL